MLFYITSRVEFHSKRFSNSSIFKIEVNWQRQWNFNTLVNKLQLLEIVSESDVKDNFILDLESD